MPRARSSHDEPRPTEAETAILEVLWRDGPSTVRAVHEALPERAWGYTTVLKLLQIMAGKGLVQRDESRRSHVYEAAVAQDAVQTVMAAEVLDRAFEGSVSTFVLRALQSRRASAAELDALRQLIDDHERDATGGAARPRAKAGSKARTKAGGKSGSRRGRGAAGRGGDR